LNSSVCKAETSEKLLCFGKLRRRLKLFKQLQDLYCLPTLNRLCQTKELAATLTKARQALKQDWPSSVFRKQKVLAQAAAREQAKASQAKQVFALPKIRKCHQ